jgi:hypothetical protein
MKPQLSWNLARFLSLLVMSAATFSTPVHAALSACTAATMPSGRTLLAVDTSLKEVFVLDASVSPVVAKCFITVGTSPTNLALSPDPNNPLLLVENDGDATITVVNLTDPSLPANIHTVTLTGITAPMTANVAVSPDGTFAYVVSLPATLTPTTQASLSVINLSTFMAAAPVSIVTTPAVPVTGPGLGVAFTPDATSPNFAAYVATEGASYAIPVTVTPTPMILKDATNSNVVAGTAAVDPGGTSAYMVDTLNTATNANVAVIAVPANSVNTLTGVTPICTFANSTALTVANALTPHQRAYYTCAGSTFIQAIDTSTNSQMAVGNVSVGSGTAHPQGIAIPYDGVTAYVGLDDGTLAAVDIASSTASPAVTVSTSLRGVAVRFVKISGLSPSTPSVPTGKTQQFTAGLGFANGTARTWTVNGMPPVSGVSGNISTVGTIDSTGLYTAPATVPAGTVKIGVTSPEAPPISNFYPLTTTVTITPSQLAFTSTAVTVTAGVCSTGITVQSQDSSNAPANPSTTETLALASGSTGGTFYSDNACATPISTTTIPTTTNSATFFYKDTKAGAPTIMVTGSGSFAATATQSETVNPAAASNLVFTNTALTLTAGACSTGITVQSQDSLGNPSNPASAETLALASNSAGATFYFDNACTIPITSTMIPTSANSSTFFYKDTKAASPTITVTGSGAFAATATQNETVNAAAASKLVFTNTPVTVTAGVCSTGITVQSQDTFGNPSNPGSAEALALASSSTGATFYSNNTCAATITSTSIATVANSVTFFYKDIKAGSPAIMVTGSGAFSATVSQTETGSAAAASQLAFSQQPSTTTAGQAIVPAVTVQVLDQFGNVVTTDTSNVSIAISSGGVLSGASTTTVAAVAGVATFTNLVPTKTGTFTLSASDAALTGATSNNFTLNPAAASKLAFSQQPSTTTAGQAIAPAVTVQVQDQFGNVVTTDTSNVSIAISSGGVLSGASTTTVAAVAGVATFNNLVPTKTGTFTLSASDGALTGTTSNNFTVNPAAASKLAFNQQPSSTTAGQAIVPAVTVQVLDQFGNVVATDTSNVSIAISSGGVLSGASTATVAAVAGVATFSNLVPTKAGTFTLSASDGTLTGATSNNFTVNPGAATTLIVAGFTSPVTAGIASNFTVTAKDASGNTATGYAGTVNFTSSDPQAVLPANYTFVVADSGMHTFSATLKTAGAQSITATDTITATITGTQTGIIVNPAAPSKLVFITAAQTLTAGVCSATITVQSQDQFNNPSNVSGNTLVSLSSNSAGTAVFSGTNTCTPSTSSATIVTGQNVASFFYSDTKAASPTITASATGLTSATQTETVNPGPPAALVYVTQPTGTSINTALAPAVVVNIQDTFGNVVTSSTAPITITSSSTSTGAGTVSGTTTVAASNGVATFSNLRFTIAGTYTLTATLTAQITVKSNPFTVTSNVAVSVMIVPSTTFLPAPASSNNPPTVAIGFSVCLMATITGDVNNLGVRTWSPTAGTISTTASQACNGVVPPTGSFTATYTAPAAVPSPATVNVTASAVADPSKISSPIMISVVSDQLVYDPANPTGQVNVPASPATSGTVVIDLQGPPNVPVSAFACTDLSKLNGKATCTFAVNPTPNLLTCPATQCTSVKLTLSVVRASAALIGPSSFPPSNGGRYSLAALFLLLPFGVSGLALFRRPRFSVRRAKLAFAFAMLLCITLGWASACNQFVVPSTPPPPIPPITGVTTGNLTVTATPGGAFAQATAPVPFAVN